MHTRGVLKKTIIEDEWVSDCCLTSTQQFIMARISYFFEWVSEWVSAYEREWVSEWVLFNANSSAISWREQVNFQWDDDEVRFVLDQHSQLDFYSASSLKQQSADRHVATLWHIILIPSLCLCSFSLMLRA
jgi:hypothetical protein